MKRYLYFASLGLWTIFLFLLGIGFLGMIVIMFAGELAPAPRPAKNVQDVGRAIDTALLIGKATTIYVYMLIGSFAAAWATGKMADCLDRTEAKRKSSTTAPSLDLPPLIQR